MHAAAAEGAGSITGRVLNPATGEYVANAEVRIAGTALAAVTERDGTYRLDRVPAGTLTLTLTYTGAAPQRVVVELAPGATAVRDFELASAAGAAGPRPCSASLRPAPAVGLSPLKYGAAAAKATSTGEEAGMVSAREGWGCSSTLVTQVASKPRKRDLAKGRPQVRIGCMGARTRA